MTNYQLKLDEWSVLMSQWSKKLKNEGLKGKKANQSL